MKGTSKKDLVDEPCLDYALVFLVLVHLRFFLPFRL